jgi:16S rRNA (guanine527-N7)-methyltransferase
MNKPAFDPAITLEASFQKWEALFLSVGVELGSDTGHRLAHYLKELKLWNRRTNLVSFGGDEELVVAHLADSLMVLLEPSARDLASARAVDVGSGGGFPGVPIAVARPGWSVTLVESVGKKTDFLEILPDRLGQANLAVEPTRAEDLGRDDAHRGRYDLAFCRAVGRFTTGLELTLPLLKVGGSWLAHRGADAPEEAAAATAALRALGGEVASLFPYRLPHLDKQRCIVRVVKTASTPDTYPRRAGMPAKRPL